MKKPQKKPTLPYLDERALVRASARSYAMEGASVRRKNISYMKKREFVS